MRMQLHNPCHNFNGGVTAVEVIVWVSDYILKFYVDIIPWPCNKTKNN